jgi:hypothetical protein
MGEARSVACAAPSKRVCTARPLDPAGFLLPTAHMLAALLLLTWGHAMAAPNGGTPLPASVRSRMEDAEYGEARRELDALLRKAMPDERRVACYVAHAVCDVSLGDDAAAQQSFQKLLVLQPGYQPDPNRTSPKVLEVFDVVRARLAADGALDQAYRPRFQPLEDTLAGTPVHLRVSFESPAAAALVRAFVRYRRVGESSFESAELARAPGDAVAFEGDIPASAIVPTDDELALDYVLDATDKDGARLTGVGTATLPLQFRVRRAEADARLTAPRPRKADGTQQALKVAAWVMPLVLGAVTVGALVLVAGAILGLTALEPGASHFFLRPRPQDPSQG